MSWSVTVKQLREELKKYDDGAVVMIGGGSRDAADANTFEMDEDVTYGYRNDDGEVFTDLESDETVARAQRVVILWPLTE